MRAEVGEIEVSEPEVCISVKRDLEIDLLRSKRDLLTLAYHIVEKDMSEESAVESMAHTAAVRRRAEANSPPPPWLRTTPATDPKMPEGLGAPPNADTATQPVIMVESWTMKKVKFMPARPHLRALVSLAMKRRIVRCGNIVAAIITLRIKEA